LGDAWTKYELGDGWAGLILCVLWEEAKGADSKWSGYIGMWSGHRQLFLTDDPLATLPTDFDTPMFWSEDELEELKGTAVVGPSAYSPLRQLANFLRTDKIGRAQAEEDYNTKIAPVIKVLLLRHLPYFTLTRGL
jgi:SET domain-containing protein 6